MIVLHQEEKMYYETLKNNRRKKSYLLGRISAKVAISEILVVKVPLSSILIQSGIFQFPVVKNIQNQNIQISISHCDTYGITLAFPEEHPLGIDIEKINEDKIDIMKDYLCVEEFQKITTCSLSMTIGSTLIWTVKEGLSKILKTGLTVDFKILEIDSLTKKGDVYISYFKYFGQYKAISYHIGDYICSIVLPKNTSLDLNLFWNILQKQYHRVISS